MLVALTALLMTQSPAMAPWTRKAPPPQNDDPNVKLRVCNGTCPSTLQGSYGESITFTRVSAWTCPNDDGTVTQLATGVPCLVKGAGGAQYGYRSRPAVTNLMQFYNALGTAPWNTGGSCTAPVVTNNTTDLTAPDGSSTATKVTFSACSGANQTIVFQTITATAANYVGSVYIRTASGTYSFYALLNGSSEISTLVTANTSWQRVAVNGTLTVASWGWEFGKQTADGAISAGTVYLWGAQLETPGLNTTTPSDVCPTAGASATCNAEALQMTAATPGASTSFCASADVNPVAWGSTEADFFGAGTGSAVNTWWTAFQSGHIFFETFDATPANKFWNPAYAPSAGTHHVRFCYDGLGDAPLIWADGAPIAAGTASGAGTGVLANANAKLNVGWGGNGGISLTGTESNFCYGTCAPASVAGIAACGACP